ncbi:MAG: molybdate ABC transporter permease subunit [Thermodesulfobacteriota bacterium]
MNYAPLILSMKLAGVTTLLLLLLGAPLAYILAFIPLRGKILLESLLGLPLVLPPTVFGFFLLMAMGPEGLGRITQAVMGQPLIFTFSGIVLAAMLHGIPYVVQPLKAAFAKLDPRLLESAAVLGCSRQQAFVRVVLPNSLPGLAGAAILSFAHTMGEFGVILMVGGSIPGETKVASIAIYEYVEAMRFSEAWQLSLALLVISYLVLLLVNLLEGRGNGS